MQIKLIFFSVRFHIINNNVTTTHVANHVLPCVKQFDCMRDFFFTPDRFAVYNAKFVHCVGRGHFFFLLLFTILHIRYLTNEGIKLNNRGRMRSSGAVKRKTIIVFSLWCWVTYTAQTNGPNYFT
jgi:hypothetical protein